MAKTSTAQKPADDAQAPATTEVLAPEAESEVVKLEKATSLSINRFGLQVEHNNCWRANVPHKVTPEQTLDEGFWEHISMHLKPGDEIHVYPDNMAWEQVLHVIGAGNQYAHVAQKVLYTFDEREDALKVPSKYVVDFMGTTHKWRVVREGRMLKDGFETEGLARRYAANHESAVNR